MILFHGTTSKFKSQIMCHGLCPRELTGKNVYAGMERFGQGLESKPDRVYLTDTYALQFAWITVGQLGGAMLVVACQVEPTWLIPDDDFERSLTGDRCELKRSLTGQSCLRSHGVCAIQGSLSAVKVYSIRKRDYEEIFGKDTCQIHAALKHRALGPRVREAQNWLLMISRKWVKVDDEWVES